MKRDIESRDDLLRLMKIFYDKLLRDPSINYLFLDVAKIDLEHHLPVLVNFWESVLFQSGTYRENAMRPHMDLHAKSPIQPQHFETWLKYFRESVDELFDGDKAFIAKERAASIATVMKIKLAQLK